MELGSDENENSSYTFNSLDSPKVLMGPNLGDPNQSNPFRSVFILKNFKLKLLIR